MGEEIDVEALQAQIDLSNSVTYDLVSSWMHPSSSKLTQSVSQTISQDLEEYARRPPRLGLGATVSKSALATSREVAKLKGKLVGQKRPRDNDIDDTPASNMEEEDEGESRSAAISARKVPTNGMREGRNKKKRRQETDVPKDDIASNAPSQANPFVIPQAPVPSAFTDKSLIKVVSPPPTGHFSVTNGPSPSKKRKKKKHKKEKSEAKGGDAVIALEEEWTGFADADPLSETIPDEEARASSIEQLLAITIPTATNQPNHPFASSSFVIDTASPTNATPPSLQRHQDPPFPIPAPLLNLHGPPVSDIQAESIESQVRKNGESPKKKPRRRRKRRDGHKDGKDHE